MKTDKYVLSIRKVAMQTVYIVVEIPGSIETGNMYLAKDRELYRK